MFGTSTVRVGLRAMALVATGLLLTAGSLKAAEFTYSEKTNDEIAKKIKMPVYFAVPASARVELPKTINTTDRLIDFKHPDANGASGDVGLRVIVAKRSGFGQRMAKSGLIQTGDIILTFRPEWGGGGAYPNIQMGISHTGIAYYKDGAMRQIDNPLNAEYLGANFGGNFDSEHYRTLKFVHIVRPRGITDAQRAAIIGWATRLNASARKIYPSQISFNSDYNAPKYQSGKPLDFVKHLARAGLGMNPQGTTSMFCSEFAWSLLALRNCDPAKSAEAFSGGGVPSCVTPVMTPMRATGNITSLRTRGSYPGLAEGPLLVLDALKLPNDKRLSLIESMFVDDPKIIAKMSEGHREVAQVMSPRFAPLQDYYRRATAGGVQRATAYVNSAVIRNAVPDNYSPTSFLINTLLPANNNYRTMDYVATVMFE